MNYPQKGISVENDRRVATRHIANLKAPVLITAICIGADNREQCLFLQGRIVDVSLTGVALIISCEDRQELESLGNEWVMHLLLPLPSEAIELEVTPVRFQPIASERSDNVLIGAQISRIGTRERAVFMEFIRDCESSSIQLTPPTRAVEYPLAERP